MSKQEPTPVNFWWLSVVIIGYIAFVVGIYYGFGYEIRSDYGVIPGLILKILGFYVAPAVVGWGLIFNLGRLIFDLGQFVYSRMNRRKTRLLLRVMMITVLIGAAGIFGYYVWPTPYRYDHTFEGGLTRINRFTGQTDILRPHGWRRVGSTP